MNMQYSAKGMTLTEGFEGLRLESYQDVAGVWTIGYGHAAPDIKSSMTITQAQAQYLLESDIQASVSCVNSGVTVALNQNQFDALVDFTFNEGRGSFLRSTLLKLLNMGDYLGACGQFAKWVYAAGEVQPGLVRRRAAEAELFQEAV
jgi:lysozyme